MFELTANQKEARKAKLSRVGVGNKEDGFQYDLLGFKPIPINVESIENVSSCMDCIAPTDIYGHSTSKNMLINHGLETENFPIPSQALLSTQFNNIQEGLFVSRVPIFQNMLSLGASTFCFPRDSSGVIKAGHDKCNVLYQLINTSTYFTKWSQEQHANLLLCSKSRVNLLLRSTFGVIRGCCSDIRIYK